MRHIKVPTVIELGLPNRPAGVISEERQLHEICASENFKAATRRLLARMKRTNAKATRPAAKLPHATPEALAGAFVADVARLRGVHAHSQLIAHVAASDVIAWLERKVRELAAAEAALFELVELPAAWPLGVKAWLMDYVHAKRRPELVLDMDKRAAHAWQIVSDYRGAFAETLDRARAVKPGRGRTKTAAAREPLIAALDALAKRHGLDAAQCETVRRIVFFDVAPATVEPPAHIKKLRRK